MGSRLLYEIVSQEKPNKLKGCETDFNIKALLRSGAKVDIAADNALTTYLESDRKPRRKRQLAMLLFAAGERLKETSVPEYLLPPKQMTLKHLCRESIRKHLLKIRKSNLFYRVPKLGLPAALNRYILYEQSVTE